MSAHVYDPEFQSIYDFVQPYTMTSAARVRALVRAVHYVIAHDVPGAIVECGVWRGGSMMAVAHTLQRLATERQLYLFDTFDGMPPAGPFDYDYRNVAATDILKANDKVTSHVWAYSPLQEVRHNMLSTGYPLAAVTFVEGKVEDTVPAHAPDEIAILRLDTDWYESTLHELQHLFPRLVCGGVLIVDDYGHWQGAKKAVDEYLTAHRVRLLLNSIDETGQIAIKLAT